MHLISKTAQQVEMYTLKSWPMHLISKTAQQVEMYTLKSWPMHLISNTAQQVEMYTLKMDTRTGIFFIVAHSLEPLLQTKIYQSYQTAQKILAIQKISKNL
jgi:hypothetical protein